MPLYIFAALDCDSANDAKNRVSLALVYVPVERSGLPGRISLNMASGWRDHVPIEHRLALELTFYELAEMPAQIAMERILELSRESGELFHLVSTGLAEYKDLPQPLASGWIFDRLNPNGTEYEQV